MSVFSKAKSFFAAHKAARVMLAAAVILLALVLICHPHGAKTFLIMGIDNYGSLNDSGRSDEKKDEETIRDRKRGPAAPGREDRPPEPARNSGNHRNLRKMREGR